MYKQSQWLTNKERDYQANQVRLKLNEQALAILNIVVCIIQPTRQHAEHPVLRSYLRAQSIECPEVTCAWYMVAQKLFF